MTETLTDDLKSIEADIDQYDSEGDPRALANALADAIAVIEEGAPGDHERFLRRLKSTHNADGTVDTAAAYARGLEHTTLIEAQSGAFDQVEATIQQLQQLHEEFREETIAVHLADALVIESEHNYADGDSRETHRNLQFVDNLSREYPGETLSVCLAAALKWAIRASYDENDYDDVRRKADRLEGLYQQYPSDEMAYHLLDGTHPKVWVACHTGDYETLSEAIERGQELLEEHDHNRLADRVAHHLRNAVIVRYDGENSRQAESNLDRFESFYEDHQDEYDVPHYFGGALARAVEHDFETGDPKQARERLDQLSSLRDHHGEEMEVTEPLAEGLKTAVSGYVEQDEIAKARDRFADLKNLVDEDPPVVGDIFAEAVQVIVEVDINNDNIETARDRLELLADLESATARLTAAELHTRLNFTEGQWGFDDDATDLTVVSESASEITLELSDPHGIEHQISVSDDRFCKTVTGAGDIPEDWSDLSPLQQKWCQFMRGYAYHHALKQTDLLTHKPSMRIENVQATLEAVESLSVDAFERLFGSYLDQHASHFAGDTPFVESIERPVDPSGVEFDTAAVRYELYVDVEDGEVVDISDIQIAVVDDEEGREVVHEAEKPTGESVGWLSMAPRPLFDPVDAKSVIENQLCRLLRDRYVDYALEPPAEARVLGEGHHRISEEYADAAVLPDFHDPQADIPGYETGRTDWELISTRVSDRIDDTYSDRSRIARDAFEQAPEPEITAARTTQTGF